jgi:hypothetical protein
MIKRLLLLTAAALALATTLSADWPIPPCIWDGSCRVDVR